MRPNRKEESSINFTCNVDKRVQILYLYKKSREVRSAGFEPDNCFVNNKLTESLHLFQC